MDATPYSTLMPLLGHAFTGMATALVLKHDTAATAVDSAHPSIPFLTTSLVVLSYLPDIISQCGLLYGWHDARQLGHSVLFALLIGPAAGLILQQQTTCTRNQCFLIATATILLHDLLDILQSTDRQPLWPFATSPVGADITIIPTDPTREALLFAAFYCCVFLVHHHRHKKHPPKKINNHATSSPYYKLFDKIFIGIIICTALTTYHLRIQRIQEFQQALPYLRRHEYTSLLQMLDKVDRWPRVAKPGRIDYLRGVACMQQHHMKAAEKYLRQSYRQDPNFFWCIADLALLYARSDRPQDARVALTQPYLRTLRKNFFQHPDYQNYMDKIQHALTQAVKIY